MNALGCSRQLTYEMEDHEQPLFSTKIGWDKFSAEEVAEWRKMRTTEYWENQQKTKENADSNCDTTTTIDSGGEASTALMPCDELEQSEGSGAEETVCAANNNDQQIMVPWEEYRLLRSSLVLLTDQVVMLTNRVKKLEGSEEKNSENMQLVTGTERSLASNQEVAAVDESFQETEPSSAVVSPNRQVKRPSSETSEGGSGTSRTKRTRKTKSDGSRYIVDKVIASKIKTLQDGEERYQYYVSWEGYSTRHNQFIDEENFDSMNPVRKYWLQFLTRVHGLNKPIENVSAVETANADYFLSV